MYWWQQWKIWVWVFFYEVSQHLKLGECGKKNHWNTRFTQECKPTKCVSACSFFPRNFNIWPLKQSVLMLRELFWDFKNGCIWQTLTTFFEMFCTVRCVCSWREERRRRRWMNRVTILSALLFRLPTQTSSPCKTVFLSPFVSLRSNCWSEMYRKVFFQ